MNPSRYERALRRIIFEQRSYLDEIVIIGGWVPYLYKRYGDFDSWNANTSLTAEVDVLVDRPLPPGDRPSIPELLRRADSTWARCREFMDRHGDAERPLRVWRRIVETSRWADHHEMKQSLPSADVIRGPRVVFDVGGNRFRIVADVPYDLGRVFIRGVYTHQEYDRIDVHRV